jgi:hypothetical protein
MLDKCANQCCTVQLHRLVADEDSFGWVLIERRRLRLPMTIGPRIEYFWLCHLCCRTNTLLLDAQNRVVVTALNF